MLDREMAVRQDVLGASSSTVAARGKRVRTQINKWRGVCLASAIALVSVTVMARQRGVVTPQEVLREIVQGMPKGERQEVRVLNVSFPPGEKTPFHTHRHPVTVYVLEGAFTMEMEGRKSVTVKAGQAMMMPPQVKMTGHNRSRTDSLRLVAFYVSDPNTPFLDPVH